MKKLTAILVNLLDFLASKKQIIRKNRGLTNMSDWNEQAAANNNLSSATIRTSKLVGKEGIRSEESSAELTNGGKKDDVVEKQLLRRQPGMG